MLHIMQTGPGIYGGKMGATLCGKDLPLAPKFACVVLPLDDPRACPKCLALRRPGPQGQPVMVAS